MKRGFYIWIVHITQLFNLILMEFVLPGALGLGVGLGGGLVWF